MGPAPATFNLADIWEFAADACSERTALICGERRFTYAELELRANRLAHAMAARGVRAGSHVGLYLENGPEYLEGMLAAYKLRAVPININYRYMPAELSYLFVDADLEGIIHHRRFASRLATAARNCPELRWSLEVDDSSDEQPCSLRGAERYEDALAAASAVREFAPRFSEDRYVIYTGGTTGMPKGVVWRHDHAFFACIGGGDPMRLQGPVSAPEELAARVIDGSFVYLPVAPLMHAAGQWTVLSWLFAGGTIVVVPGSLDPRAVWQTVERERVNLLTVVGDAVVRPLVDEWERSGPYDISSLFSLASGGAPLTPALKRRLTALLGGVTVVDGFGSSETGAQGAQRLEGGAGASALGAFTPYGDTTAVLDDATLEPVAPGSGQVGRVALRGHIPEGYYKDPERTAATFVTAGGHRWVLTGDFATVETDGAIRLLGRASVCINTGGEKVFPEEVEAVLKGHPGVYDAVVVGLPDERWGERVVALVATAGPATEQDLIAHCREQLAGYKVPKEVVFVEEISRSPAGKPDYVWARRVAAGEAGVRGDG